MKTTFSIFCLVTLLSPEEACTVTHCPSKKTNYENLQMMSRSLGLDQQFQISPEVHVRINPGYIPPTITNTSHTRASLET